MINDSASRSPLVEEQSIVARITRYSNLRGVERALLPSVRNRRQLPTASLGSDLLQRLQALLEQVQQSRGHTAGLQQRVAVSLAEVDGALDRFRRELLDLVRDTPLPQLRATLPGVIERSRTEVVALLDLCLSAISEQSGGEPPHCIDYLITLLSRQSLQGVSVLRCDPSRVSPGLQARCRMQSADPCPECEVSIQRFREASMEILELENLGPIVARMREIKAKLGSCLFDADVLRAMVAYNIAAANRFRELFEIAQASDRKEEHTLQTLQQRGCVPAVQAEPAAPRDVTKSAIMRAAVLVGLSLRDLPSLSDRLRQIEIDASRGGAGWLRDLDGVLQEAIRLLTQAGRTEDAARLTRMRMQSLVGA